MNRIAFEETAGSNTMVQGPIRSRTPLHCVISRQTSVSAVETTGGWAPPLAPLHCGLVVLPERILRNHLRTREPLWTFRVPEEKHSTGEKERRKSLVALGCLRGTMALPASYYSQGKRHMVSPEGERKPVGECLASPTVWNAAEETPFSLTAFRALLWGSKLRGGSRSGEQHTPTEWVCQQQTNRCKANNSSL